MTSIASAAIDGAFWPVVADTVLQGLAGQGAAPRDAVVVLPHAGLLGVARAAFAARGGWQPRIETPATLAASLAPPIAAEPGMLSGDRVADRLVAATLLRGVGPAVRDPRAQRALVAAFVETALALHQASARQPPEARAAWWQALRQALPPGAGPGATERRLARMALEWAAAAEAPASDVLRSLRPSAWIVVGAAGQDSTALLPADAERVLHLDADGDGARPFDAAAHLSPPRCLVAADLEEEAQAAAIAVVQALDDGATSIALIAQDRLVVRRIRALLERAGVAVDDDSGWTLSTTRAAARLMAWLRAAEPGAGRDACIEALRAENAAPHAVDALEAAWRRERAPAPHALALDDEHANRVAAWQPAQPRTLTQWLHSLREAAPRLIDALAADAAGRQVLDVLALTDAPDVPWQAIAQTTRMDLAQFIAWADETLEDSAWRPTALPATRVAIVPLARAALRPFDAIVFPGCDAQHLGGGQAEPGLLPAAVAREFGVAAFEQRREQQALAFALLLRAPRVVLLRRRHHEGEALAPSPLLERALLARRRLNAAVPDETIVTLPRRRIATQLQTRPAPSMDQALPARLSATTAQALRDCPYRFFAKVGLGLIEADELDAALDNRGYGRWMHGLLHRFHAMRSGNDDLRELTQAADAEQAALGLDDAALLPYRVAFDHFAVQYLAWLQGHEADGWRFAGGEVEQQRAPPALNGIELYGRLDRIDRNADGAALLIDYKTGAAAKLAQRVAAPLEDTQLAFYAALLNDEATPPRALYLALSERKPPQAIEHKDVASSAALLVEGLAADMAALREGAGAPALGEGEVCEHCEARGLCRRDHWQVGA
jgi:ATP-dependent helicase/nuclease subunit B